MKFYISKDDTGILFFKDCPDLVKYTEDSDIEWVGYPIDFGDFKSIKDMILEHPNVKQMMPYSRPLEITIDLDAISIE